MSLQTSRVQAALRAFIHTSSRSCKASWAASSSSFRLYSPDDAPPAPALENASTELDQSAASEPLVSGGYIERLLPDKRSGRLVKYVFPTPNFTLKQHPLAEHPCVSGLGLDHGNTVPAKPIPTWQIIKRKRNEQRAQTQLNCNLPDRTVSLWRSFWSRHYETEDLSHLETHVSAYPEPITYVGLKHKKSPTFARGPTSVLMTCHLEIYQTPDADLELNELGVPVHVTDLLFALPLRALNSGTPDLPTVTRISPAHYVLTCKSIAARTALLSGWEEFVHKIEQAYSRAPPYTLEPDPAEEPAHDPETALPKHAHEFLRSATHAGLDARYDGAGGLWIGTTRYARMEDLPKLLLERARAAHPASRPVSRPVLSGNPKRGRQSGSREPSHMWAMPPELSKLLS
ncbi:hypothetical protein EXIGLDRAFT_729252 [Exidia glandulosa HHB12029]|uniref:Uncharacterized protein n=1 Tax=Exidia glandulosa HHB12029 TaxID=1314781 RepID=A0A165CNW0_EXIGL|nr:hypothetical protein EXIGLDRAFT_729252 [Exidia glandulosa HHB12029]